MTKLAETIQTDCYCYVAKKQVWLRGKLVGKRQGELLDVTGCEELACSKRNSMYCLIGKIREGQWTH